jgi:hypothetical protein
MIPDSAYELRELGRLLAVLRPAPTGWVEAAQGLPRARRELDDLLARAAANAELRARLVADLESALAEAGIALPPHAVAAARARLDRR